MKISALILVAALPAYAEVANFASLKAQAVVPERPSEVVASIVGRCADGLMVDELESCEKNLAAAKKTVDGKTAWVQLTSASPIRFERRTAGGGVRLVWAPLVDVGNGLAITVGKPLKLSLAGTVVVAVRPIEGVSDVELSDSDIARALQTQQVGIEALVRFGKSWELSGSKGVVRGVAVEVVGVRFFHTRSNKTVLESVKP